LQHGCAARAEFRKTQSTLVNHATAAWLTGFERLVHDNGFLGHRSAPVGRTTTLRRAPHAPLGPTSAMVPGLAALRRISTVASARGHQDLPGDGAMQHGRPCSVVTNLMPTGVSEANDGRLVTTRPDSLRVRCILVGERGTPIRGSSMEPIGPPWPNFSRLRPSPPASVCAWLSVSMQ
jgi:hypothetical protein